MELLQRLESDFTANLDLKRLVGSGNPRLTQLRQHRENAFDTLLWQAQFVVKCVGKMLARTKTTKAYKVALVGANGILGKKLIKHLLGSGTLQPDNLIVCTRHGELEGLPETVYQTHSVEEALENGARLVILACRPSQMGQVAKQLRPLLKPTIVVCSLLAAYPLPKLRSILGIPHPVSCVSRVMCNLSSNPEEITLVPSTDTTQTNACKELYYSRDGTLANLVEAGVAQIRLLGVDTEESSEIVTRVVHGSETESKYELDDFQRFEHHFRKQLLPSR